MQRRVLEVVEEESKPGPSTMLTKSKRKSYLKVVLLATT